MAAVVHEEPTLTFAQLQQLLTMMKTPQPNTAVDPPTRLCELFWTLLTPSHEQTLRTELAFDGLVILFGSLSFPFPTACRLLRDYVAPILAEAALGNRHEHKPGTTPEPGAQDLAAFEAARDPAAAEAEAEAEREAEREDNAITATRAKAKGQLGMGRVAEEEGGVEQEWHIERLIKESRSYYGDRLAYKVIGGLKANEQVNRSATEKTLFTFKPEVNKASTILDRRRRGSGEVEGSDWEERYKYLLQRKEMCDNRHAALRKAEEAKVSPDSTLDPSSMHLHARPCRAQGRPRLEPAEGGCARVATGGSSRAEVQNRRGSAAGPRPGALHPPPEHHDLATASQRPSRKAEAVRRDRGAHQKARGPSAAAGRGRREKATRGRCPP